MVITVSEDAGIRCQVGDFSLLVDSPSKRKGDLILRTKTETPINTFNSPEVIFGPGEYEVSGVRVRGIDLPNESDKDTVRSIYTAELEGMHLAFFLNISGDLPENTLDKLGEVDALFISVDVKEIKPKQIISLIKQIDPSIIIPTTDKTAKVLSEEMGQKVKAQEKLVIKRKDLIKEDVANKLIWLKAK